MKKFFNILIILIISIFMVTPAWAEDKDSIFFDAGFMPVKEKIAARDFSLEDLGGRQVALKNFRGKIVLVFFWTTW
jgi:cytochrome oxidase Cu insertion factor (SCO1/SenC/PrrC family)